MARFKVSRTPVREVIRRLLADGLVGMEPHRSAYVRPLSLRDIADFFEAYQITQRMVFIISAERISKEQLASITKIEQELEKACKSKKIRAVRELNVQFHSAIASACSNRYLQESYIKLLEHSIRLSSLTLRFTAEVDWNEHSLKIQRDHNKIVRALARKDGVAIGDISDQHVKLFKDQVYRALEKTTPDLAQFRP